jgi:predicted metal-dependent phosphotriesterase family hydrolase
MSTSLDVKPTEGVVLLAESIYAILPGADLVPDRFLTQPKPSKPELIAALTRALLAFKAVGGQAIVDLAGLTMGRDVTLNDFLARETGVEIHTATGFGPDWSVGSHYYNNVSEEGMTLDRLAAIFIGEGTEGALIPNRGRASPVPLVVLTGRAGALSLPEGSEEFRHELQTAQSFVDMVAHAHARAARVAKIPLYVRLGDDPLRLLAIIADEGLPASQVVLGGLDRSDHAAAGLPLELAARGHNVVLDHVGWPQGWLSGAERATLVLEFFARGLGDRVAVSSSGVGVAVEVAAPIVGDFTRVLTDFVPAFRIAGGTDEQLTQVLATNPARFLAGMEI